MITGIAIGFGGALAPPLFRMAGQQIALAVQRESDQARQRVEERIVTQIRDASIRRDLRVDCPITPDPGCHMERVIRRILLECSGAGGGGKRDAVSIIVPSKPWSCDPVECDSCGYQTDFWDEKVPAGMTSKPDGARVWVCDWCRDGKPSGTDAATYQRMNRAARRDLKRKQGRKR